MTLKPYQLIGQPNTYVSGCFESDGEDFEESDDDLVGDEMPDERLANMV